MPRRLLPLLSVTVCLCGSLALADDYTLESVDQAPEGVSDDIAALINPTGYKVVGPRRDYCEIWLLKEVPAVKDFAAQLTVKYPLTPGELVGVMRVPRRSGIADFRGQELDDGIYTLRYGQQPMDGNHIGTSPTSDFLMASPAGEDTAPGVIDDMKKLVELSAAAAGTNHPAVFSLLPVGDVKIDKASLAHDEDQDFYILQVNAVTPEGKPLPLRLVVVGESAG